MFTRHAANAKGGGDLEGTGLVYECMYVRSSTSQNEGFSTPLLMKNENKLQITKPAKR